MSDIFTTEKRSKIMGLVKGKNTRPEIIVRTYLHSHGFRYKLHDNKLPGSPDIKLTKYNTLVLINGCFWHKHEVCKPHKLPKSNAEFWKAKIEKNHLRDKANLQALLNNGWNVLVIWECELKKNIREQTLANLIIQIRANYVKL